MSKTKVMHILCTNSFSGAENVAVSLINNFKSEYDFVYACPEGPIQDVLKENDIEFCPIKSINPFTFKKAIKKVRPDIIHAHDFMAGFFAVLAAGKTPVINHLHNNAPWIKTFNPLTVLYSMSAKKMRKILTVSEAIMNEFYFGNSYKHKTSVIGNQTDISLIRQKAAASELSEPYDIIFLGRLSEPKNPIGFLEIISDLKATFPHIRAIMVGDGELRSQVEEKITELKLSDNVTLMGFQKNPYVFLKSAKIMCAPSLWEGYSLASVEALALGKPILASPVGGLVNIVNDECGKLCNNKNEFLEQLSLLLTNQKIYEEKSKNASLRADIFNNVTEYKKAIKSAYDDIDQ